MKKGKSAVIVFLLGFLLQIENVHGDWNQETACFKIYKKIVMDFASESPEIAADKEIKAWSSHKKQCQKTGEYEMYLAELYCDKKDYKKCRLLSEEVITKKGKSCDVRVAERTLITIDSEERDLQSAKARAEAMIKKYPDWYMGYYFYGVSLLKEEKNLESIKYFERANTLQEDAYTYGWLALLSYIEHHDCEKVLKLYEKAYHLGRKVLLMRAPTLATIGAAMQLNNWNFAKNLLDYQKKIDPSIVNNENYKKLSLRMDDYIKTNCSE